ncbi:MAG: UDP-N-acetylglucosamine diphosphorylase/glucosamine-1-phosphate N-acetyltransferase [Gammaproteobacteria bacterium]|nr:MAG: UDP-N-acetylglucosamine diphosphorylase/glucosamine-1-phosphate N-acetyltransferase [Gammaproteobacteria bacterium]
MSLEVIILAAGQGKRMRSRLPKVLHQLAGQPLLSHVLKAASSIGAKQIHVVYGHGGDMVKSAFPDTALRWVHQQEQNGTGHAVELALQGITDEVQIMILYGDVPMIKRETLHKMVNAGFDLVVLTAVIENPSGYGRILRNSTGQITGIIEERDANNDQKAIKEINTGIMLGRAEELRYLLAKIDCSNDQAEMYLTDVISIAVDRGLKVGTVRADSEIEITGINDKLQLAAMEREKQLETANDMMRDGLTLRDPGRLDVRGELKFGMDVVIDVNVIIEGQVELGDGVVVGPNVYLRDCVIGSGTQIKSNCVLEEADIGENAVVGPFARIRPGTRLAKQVHIGNFVEIKNSQVKSGAKINHLSYVGDSSIGERVNVGAGTITCNYDGANKHHTEIGDDAFIGSGTELVAPVSVGAGATIGAGSTITRDAPANELTLERNKQRSISGWQRPKKKG